MRKRVICDLGYMFILYSRRFATATARTASLGSHSRASFHLMFGVFFLSSYRPRIVGGFSWPCLFNGVDLLCHSLMYCASPLIWMICMRPPCRRHTCAFTALFSKPAFMIKSFAQNLANANSSVCRSSRVLWLCVNCVAIWFGVADLMQLQQNGGMNVYQGKKFNANCIRACCRHCRTAKAAMQRQCALRQLIIVLAVQSWPETHFGDRQELGDGAGAEATLQQTSTNSPAVTSPIQDSQTGDPSQVKCRSCQRSWPQKDFHRSRNTLCCWICHWEKTAPEKFALWNALQCQLCKRSQLSLKAFPPRVSNELLGQLPGTRGKQENVKVSCTDCCYPVCWTGCGARATFQYKVFEGQQQHPWFCETCQTSLQTCQCSMLLQRPSTKRQPSTLRILTRSWQVPCSQACYRTIYGWSRRNITPPWSLAFTNGPNAPGFRRCLPTSFPILLSPCGNNTSKKSPATLRSRPLQTSNACSKRLSSTVKTNKLPLCGFCPCLYFQAIEATWMLQSLKPFLKHLKKLWHRWSRHSIANMAGHILGPLEKVVNSQRAISWPKRRNRSRVDDRTTRHFVCGLAIPSDAQHFGYINLPTHPGGMPRPLCVRRCLHPPHHLANSSGRWRSYSHQPRPGWPLYQHRPSTIHWCLAHAPRLP